MSSVKWIKVCYSGKVKDISAKNETDHWILNTWHFVEFRKANIERLDIKNRKRKNSTLYYWNTSQIIRGMLHPPTCSKWNKKNKKMQHCRNYNTVYQNPTCTCISLSSSRKSSTLKVNTNQSYKITATKFTLFFFARLLHV